MNPIKTTFILICPTLLLVAMGSAVDGQAGMFVALAVACVFLQSIQTKSSSRMYQAREVSEPEYSAFRGMFRCFAPSDRTHPQGVRTMKRQVIKVFTVMFAAALLSVSVFELNAEARAGKSRSSGSRGAQSYSKPAGPAAQPSPTRQQVAPAPTANPQPAGGGFMRSMAGGIMGGMLGSMLFSSFAGAGEGAVEGMGGMGGSGVGLFEILLLAGGGYFLFRYIGRRRAYAPATASGPSGYPREAVTPMVLPQQNPMPLQDELDACLDHIRRMDPAFDPSRFNDAAMDSFFKIQGAWMNRDLAPVSGLLSEEMVQIFQADLDQLLQDKQINKLENIAVRKVEIVEASQELGHDYVTVSIYANLLDFTIDEMTGAVLSGSKEDPVKFQEYWTFTRPVGNNPWRLTAIQQQ